MPNNLNDEAAAALTAATFLLPTGRRENIAGLTVRIC